MARKSTIYYGSVLLLFIFGCSLHEALELFDDGRIEYMSREERDTLKQEARNMFYHAYNAYMDNAYPADELMPLSCKGRYRGSEPDRGDIDSTLGNFSLTLVDTLDTLVVMGNLKEFEKAVKLVIKDVTFDTDVIVSLFETNIRVLGGLLSGHILADYIKERENAMAWYKGELLNLAKDLGYRFLPAFNTTTGIPFGRINLKYGMKGVPLEMTRETCTACAGSMILEMAALSRLTGDSIFEEKAQKAMDVLWRLRHRGTDLMGSVLNVNSGDWVRRDSGVGAGIDSYYEYCLKAYILLGDEKYLGRFNKHYQAIMKYISQGPMLLDVHMHRPNTNSKNFMDALLAFWPGVQVLKGDIKPAVETHEMLYQVMQRHNFIPEAFTTDFQVHWGHHPLRPEFLESTYFLYKATGDHYYLGVGKKVLKSLQTYARVPCGFAAVSDVRTNKHDDTMDSFVLSETFKYLFLLFADPGDLLLDLDEYVFTTEGHLLPLSLASVRTNLTMDIEREKVHVEETDRTCPNSLHLFPASVRQPLRNMVEDMCPKRAVRKRLSASQFQPSNLEHSRMLSDMGITILTVSDGSVQLLHTFSNAKSPQDAEEGLLFMQEMVELSKFQAQQAKSKPILLTFLKPSPQPNSQPPQKVTLLAGPAHFGADLKSNKVTGKVLMVLPFLGCSELINPDLLKGAIVIVYRGNCMFIDKARRIQKAGAIAGIVLDNVVSSSVHNSPMFAMSGDGKQVDDVTIPFVFLFSIEANQLLQAMASARSPLFVTIGGTAQKNEVQLKAPTDESLFEQLKGTLRELLTQQLSFQNHQALESRVEAEPLSFARLRAFFKDDSVIPSRTIVIKLNAYEKGPDAVKYVADDRSSWMLMKKFIVNELFGIFTSKHGFAINEATVLAIYAIVMNRRGAEKSAVAAASKADKVLWFLEELSQVQPEQAVIINYYELYPATDKQYLLSYLFWEAAYSIKGPISVRDSGLIKLAITQCVALDFFSGDVDKLPDDVRSFLNKYLPVVIDYVLKESSQTKKEDSDFSILFLQDFIGEKIREVNRINDHVDNNNNNKNNNNKSTSKKRTAEIGSSKKGVINIEVAAPSEILKSKNRSRSGAGLAGTQGHSNVQSSSRRSKGDETDEILKELVPDVFVKGSKPLDDDHDDNHDDHHDHDEDDHHDHDEDDKNDPSISRSGKKGFDQVEGDGKNADHQTVSDKEEHKRVHGDL